MTRKRKKPCRRCLAIPLDGSPRRKLTAFDEHVIFTFAPLAGEKGWVLSRGDLSRDVVLITGFRPPF